MRKLLKNYSETDRWCTCIMLHKEAGTEAGMFVYLSCALTSQCEGAHRNNYFRSLWQTIIHQSLLCQKSSPALLASLRSRILFTSTPSCPKLITKICHRALPGRDLVWSKGRDLRPEILQRDLAYNLFFHYDLTTGLTIL